MVSRPTEDPQSPTHQFRLTDAQGQPMTFSDMAQAEAARAQHLRDFPADSANVVPADTAERP